MLKIEKDGNDSLSIKHKYLPKIHRPQPGLNPQTLDLKASTLPQDHRGRELIILNTVELF